MRHDSLYDRRSLDPVTRRSRLHNIKPHTLFEKKGLAMKRRTLIIVAAFLPIIVWVALPAAAQITSVTVRVDGLSCPFCAYSLEKNIKAMEGTKEPVINVEEGTVTLTPVVDLSVDFDGLRDAVKKAGFTPREIRVAGVGRLATIRGRPALIAEDGQQLFLLMPNDVLAGLQMDAEHIVTFSGTVGTRENDDEATLWTIALLSTAPRAKGDAN